MALVHSWRRSAGPPADRRHQEVEADGLLIRRSPFSFSSVREVAACWPRDTAVRWVGGGAWMIERIAILNVLLRQPQLDMDMMLQQCSLFDLSQ